MQRRVAARGLRQIARRVCLLELVPQSVILTRVKGEVRLGQPLLLRAGDLPLDQIIEVGKRPSRLL